MPLHASHHPGQTVGAKLRAARLAKRYTQNQLAHPDFSISYISAIERGQIQPSLRALEILAQRLGMDMAHLLPQHEQLEGGQLAGARRDSLASMERELLLVEAQIAVHQGDSARAIDLLHPLLTQKGKQSLAIYYVLGWAYLEGGYVQESEYTLAEAAKMAQETADPLYPRILHLQGAMYTAMHSVEQAIRSQLASLAALEQWPDQVNDVFFLAQVYMSLGQGYSYLEQFVEALEMFQRSLTLLQARLSSAQLSTLYHNLSEYYTAKEQPLWATLYTYKWQQADLRTRLATLKSEIQYNLGHALLKSGSDEAYGSLLALAQESSLRQDPLGRASAMAHLAAWFIARGEISKAEPYVHESHFLASPFGETIIGAEVLVLQGEIAYARHDYEQGDHYFTSGLAIFERLQASEDLVEHLTNYARLLEERGDIQKAIIYWKQAYKSRQKGPV